MLTIRRVLLVGDADKKDLNRVFTQPELANAIRTDDSKLGEPDLQMAVRIVKPDVVYGHGEHVRVAHPGECSCCGGDRSFIAAKVAMFGDLTPIRVYDARGTVFPRMCWSCFDSIEADAAAAGEKVAPAGLAMAGILIDNVPPTPFADELDPDQVAIDAERWTSLHPQVIA